MTQATMRQETDSIGAIDVPADAYWGAQTQRSIANFPFGQRDQMPLPIVHALAMVEGSVRSAEEGRPLEMAALLDGIDL